MDSSDSLKIDENLARLLAAYDQSIDGGDAEGATVQVPVPPDDHFSPNERPVTPLRGSQPNEGSMGEVLPDPERTAQIRPPFFGATPPPGGTHRVGRFELRRQLGKGGCGIVFLAYDPKLEREVALKIPRPEMLLNSDAKNRLKREALAAAEFDHPNLVPVYDFGEVGPLCYIATAFCPGQTLAEWHDRQAFPVPVRQAARLLATVAEAVQHAHDRGVLHRDLKPNNVILQEMKLEENDEPPPGSVQLRGEHYVPRLVDFGLAKLLERGGPSETGTRQILGTPKYMSPEQAQARREDIGPTADVYALGVILYELIAGRAPYEGASDIEVLRQAIEGKPTPPRALRPDVPRDLEAICLKAMARTPPERYRTAIDLADDLRRFLDERPTIARPLAWPGRAVRWLRRNDQIVAIVVLATIVVFVTTVSSWNWYLMQQVRRDNNDFLNAQANRNRTEQEREYSRQMREAFLAWRGGNMAAATAALDGARRVAGGFMEQPDFTHDYLRKQLKSPQLMIVCPAGPVTALAVSPDGTRIASGHADGTVAVWDRATGRQLGVAKASEREVMHVAFALSGTLLVTNGKQANSSEMLGWSIGADGGITLATGYLRDLGKGMTCLAVSPDGQTLFAGGRNGLVRKENLRAWSPAETQSGASPVVAVVVSKDGQRVLTASQNGSVRVWAQDLTNVPARDSVFGGQVTSLGLLDGGLPLVGFVSGECALGVPGTPPPVFSTGGRVQWLATAPGNRFALSAAPGRVLLGGSELLTGDTGEIRAGVFSPDGKTLFTGSQDGIIRAWTMPSDLRDRAARQSGHVTAIGVSFDGSSFVVADAHHLTRYDGTAEGKSATGVPPLAAVRILDDGTTRGVSLDGRFAVLHDLRGSTSSERLRARIPDRRNATCAALSSNGAHLALGDDFGRVVIWTGTDLNTATTVDTGVRRPVRRVAISDNGRHVAVPTANGVGVWSVATSDQVVSFETDEQTVFRFLPNSEQIVTAGRDGVVRVWNFAGREDFTLYGHVGSITGLGVSPDGRTLVSGSATGEVKFWDLRTGQELFSLRRHSVPVTVIEFAPGARLLVTGGDGQYAVWDARE